MYVLLLLIKNLPKTHMFYSILIPLVMYTISYRLFQYKRNYLLCKLVPFIFTKKKITTRSEILFNSWNWLNKTTLRPTSQYFFLNFLLFSKGQLILKAKFKVFIWTERKYFCNYSLWSNEKTKANYYIRWHIITN